MTEKTKEFKNNQLKVQFSNDLDTDTFTIKLVEGFGWNTTYYYLFKNNELFDNSLPHKMGIYTLSINYSNTHYYQEIILYKRNPTNEKLSFNFYKDGNRIFSTIQSDNAEELNKEIVLTELSTETRALLESINKE